MLPQDAFPEREFRLKSDFQAAGDQPEAISRLLDGLRQGLRYQTLRGVTGSGKTFTMANIIAGICRPTLVLAHNKTLAAQLCNEFRGFFPDNAVEYFVSYYDYYQPEAYIPQTDSYIEKDFSINDEVDRLRHAATQALITRRDVIIVASVSCIYGLGMPEDYADLVVNVRLGEEIDRRRFIKRLVEVQYQRNDAVLERGSFRARGDIIEIVPANSERVIRIEFFGDEVERILEIDALTGEVLDELRLAVFFPARHWVTTQIKLEQAMRSIDKELEERLHYLRDCGKLLEAQRLEQRTRYDMDMLWETGYCQGVENYSRHFDGRRPGEPPYTLLDYFPDDYLLFIDESHVTCPQVRAMYGGDKSRKDSLVDYGFRLPCAYDNRPLHFEEFTERINQCIFVSATPGPFEASVSRGTVEQIIRPTGLVDPEVIVRPAQNQVDDLIGEIRMAVSKGERVLVTALTKRMAEDLTEYLADMGLKVNYLHSDVATLERVEVLRDLRSGVHDVIVGINLLREGLDLPEVALVAILDADKEGFLRSETSLVQTIGRAARNLAGRVILYADKMTDSMERAIVETERRRRLQEDYNRRHDITPESVHKAITDIAEGIEQKRLQEAKAVYEADLRRIDKGDPTDKGDRIARLEREMKRAAQELDFELAAWLRDRIKELK
ncbi:MAG: excinuclease ABC subunit UvrB [bacterium]|nr:excinuclease ABC subunit UvrB [bacterium]MDD3805700.1 excinuclease ABC subunit UvrB [bacterium]MDD4558303.1 excinuclease ABC subunit UvrB [bacterium]